MLRTLLFLSALLILTPACASTGPESPQGPTLAGERSADPFPAGKSLWTVDFGGTPLNLWVYKSPGYDGEGFVLLFHGASRAAERYRDQSVGYADAHRTLVVIPEFDAERFPSRAYQFGGVFREDGTFAAPEERTFAFVPRIVDHVRTREGDPELTPILLGYSAGAQFLDRMAAVHDPLMEIGAERLVVMSPGSALFPTREMDYGLGFGGLPAEYASDERIRRYLALPITIAIGTEDRLMSQLPTGDAYRQGVHRYSRNLRFFNEAMDLAYQREWEFNWRLVIAHGAGHSPPDMFDHPQMGNALYGHR